MMCLYLCLLGVVGFLYLGPVHVAGLVTGFAYPTPRLTNLDVQLTQGVCDYALLGAPTSTLYYGRNQLVVTLGDFTQDNSRQITLYGYVNSNSVNKSTAIAAGPYGGVYWSYDVSSARVLSSVTNSTSPPANFPQNNRIWHQTWEIDIPQGLTCTPHCTLQLLGTTVSVSGSRVSAVSCADFVLLERRPTSVYMTLRPDGCCPLEPQTIARRLYEMSPMSSNSNSNSKKNVFSSSSYPLWDYTTEMSQIISNVWYIDTTAPNTLKINPQTGYYSVKLVIHDQYNQTAQQFITTLTNTQLVSSALSPDSRGANNSYVWWGDVPNTYPGGNGKPMNAAAATSSSPQHISIFTGATACIAYIIANKAHI